MVVSKAPLVPVALKAHMAAGDGSVSAISHIACLHVVTCNAVHKLLVTQQRNRIEYTPSENLDARKQAA